MNRFAASPVLALSLSGILLAGCVTLEPTYTRPAAPIPAAFAQATVQVAAPPPSLVAWKTIFRDPKLQSLIQTALTQNRNLRATVANVRAASAQFEIQRSQLFPTVNAQGAVTWSREPVVGFGVLQQRQITADVGVSNYEVDLFGRLRSLSKSAFETYLASDEGRRAAQLSLVAEVADAYLTLAADRSLLKVSLDTQHSGEETLSLTQRRFDIGVASQLDVSQAETVVQQARANAAAYAIAATQAKDALDLLVGSVVPDTLTPAGLEETTPSFAVIPAGISSAVLLDRPDVLQAEDQLRAANAQIGAARAAFFPSITLTGQGGGASPNLTSLFSSANAAWTFGPTVNLPLFTGGRNIGNLRYSKAQRDAAVATYENAVQGAFRDVADSLAALTGTARQLQAQQALVDASSEALKLATARYEHGADTYLNMLDSQRSLYSAQQGLISIQLASTSNLVSLYRALGGGADSTAEPAQKAGS
jgi:multidrug efflux system outer membrane protein